MTSRLIERMTQLLADGPDPRKSWLDEPAEQLQGGLMALLEQAGDTGQKLKDVLHGTWLGHALHPALILGPAGSWLTAAVLDLVGDEDGARTAIGFGILASLPAAASGLVDWGYTEGRSRRLGLAHAGLNSAALGLYTLSWLARRNGHRGLGVLLSTKGLLMMTASAYLGGEISYALGQGVNRNAWSPDVGDTSDELDDFRPVAKLDDLTNTLQGLSLGLPLAPASARPSGGVGFARSRRELLGKLRRPAFVVLRQRGVGSGHALEMAYPEQAIVAPAGSGA